MGHLVSLAQYPTYPETFWLVAIIATFLKLGAILEFLLYREVEYLFANRKLAVDIFLREAKVDDVEEA